MSKKNNRTVVITGGAKGIGRAICLAFAGPDTKIFFSYLSSKEAALQTEQMIIQAGGQAESMKVDVVCEDQVQQFFKHIIEQTGTVDILVNNAGVAKDNLLIKMKNSEWNDVLDTNLKGVFNCTKIAARAMLRGRWGRIINITSVVALTGNPGQVNYAASKAGIIGFTKAAAKELGSRGITVNAIAPGYVETEMTSSFSDEIKNFILNMVPLKRTAKPEEIAAAVQFLGSEKASYITGQIISVDGGLH